MKHSKHSGHSKGLQSSPELARALRALQSSPELSRARQSSPELSRALQLLCLIVRVTLGSLFLCGGPIVLSLGFWLKLKLDAFAHDNQ